MTENKESKSCFLTWGMAIVTTLSVGVLIILVFLFIELLWPLKFWTTERYEAIPLFIGLSSLSILSWREYKNGTNRKTTILLIIQTLLLIFTIYFILMIVLYLMFM